jgi:flagellar biosynthesis protein FlhA
VQNDSIEASWDDVTGVDTLSLEVGYRLIPLVDTAQGGDLLKKIKGLRKKFAQGVGFLSPSVHISDNLELKPSGYLIKIRGVEIASGESHFGRFLAINPGMVSGQIAGQATKDPAFGLPAIWIDEKLRDQAQGLGYTVVDASTAISTHLNKVLRENASDLLSHDEVQQLLDKLSAKSPKLVEELVPGKMSLGVLTRTLQNLLNESVSIRDMRTIVETLTEASARTTDPEQLAAMVRPKLGRMIMQALVDEKNNLSVMTLEPSLEQLLHNVLQQSQPGQPVVLEPGLAESLFAAMRDGARAVEEEGHPAVLVVSPVIRGWLSKAARYRVNDLTVLSYSEIPDDQPVKVIHTVSAQPK